MIGSVILAGLFTVALGVSPLAIALALIAGKGFLDMLFEVAVSSHLQSSVASTELGAAFGRLDAWSAGAQLLGVAATPALLGLTSPRATVTAFGFALIVVGAAVWFATLPERPNRAATQHQTT